MTGDNVREKSPACRLRRLLFRSLECPKFSFLVKGDERHDRRHVREQPLACRLRRLTFCLLKTVNFFLLFL